MQVEVILIHARKKMDYNFILVDSFQSGLISLKIVGVNSIYFIEYNCKYIFMQLHDGCNHLNNGKRQGMGTEQRQISTRTERVNMMAIHQKLKSMLRRLEGSEFKIENSQYL